MPERLPSRCVDPSAGAGAKKIKEVVFGLLGPAEMSRLAEFECCNRELYRMPARTPAPNGCLDLRLGASTKKAVCETCKKRVEQCAGHYGYVKLELPVFHVGYLKAVQSTLQCVCKACSRVLLSSTERAALLKKMRRPDADALKKAQIHKRVIDRCKTQSICSHCGARNGTIRKVNGSGSIKLAHEKWRGVKPQNLEDDEEYADFALELKSALAASAELRAATGRDLSNKKKKKDGESSDEEEEEEKGSANKAPSTILSPLDVRRIFERISVDDCELLWCDAEQGRPEDLILSSVLVPPTPIRPSVPVEGPGGGSNEDDLTIKLQEIIDVNTSLRASIVKGGSIKMITECWNFLQVQVCQYLNGEMPGFARQGPAAAQAKPIRGLCQRLKGKAGRFRGNLSGKRVDFSARTVISPDPNLRIDQVGVPVHVARVMTFPERVNRHNIEKLRRLVQNGPHVHPGANYIELARDAEDEDTFWGGGGNDSGAPAFKKSLLYGDREKLAKELRIGDVVERHMEDGDIVLFNRQPSLHKLSIMSHRAKIMEWRTFRFNECVCSPYNADFDGDEMNMHLPQTDEARAEALVLMAVPKNICTPRNGEPLVAATQDFITSSFLLTQRDVFFHREQFCAYAAYLGDGLEAVDIPEAAILRPCKLWTGKQLFSLLVRPNFREQLSTQSIAESPSLGQAPWPLLSFELAERNYTGSKTDMCPLDGWVVFRNSQLLAGNVAKKTIGEGSKDGLVYCLQRDHGAECAARCMNRFAKLAGRYMGYHKGFSIGIDDVTPSKEVLAGKAFLLKEGLDEAAKLISQFEDGTLPLQPGCDGRQSLEATLTGLLGSVRESAGKGLMKTQLKRTNSPRIMAECGSKGSAINVSQMIACLGQQAVDGKRIANGFVARTLPHFAISKALEPAAKGFVANSFFSGLSATEFFFHTMGGREGLVDTAVKTAQTGYMARRLMKALEDLSLMYDGTVRNSESAIVQLAYGDDGLNPGSMETDLGPTNFERLLLNVRASVSSKTKTLEPEDLERFAAVLTQKKRVILKEDQGTLYDFWTTAKRRELIGTKFARDVAQTLVEIASYQRRILSDLEKSGDLTAEEAKEVVDRFKYQTALTMPQLEAFCEACVEKYSRSVVEPGEAVGAVGAQCISEPGTQMTLKTFHFAGVASMNVTLGVPRLTEIINASKSISTPIITAQLDNSGSKTSARVVKARLEKTTLGEVAESVKEVYGPTGCYLSVKLDMRLIAELQLNVTAVSTRIGVLNAASSFSGRAPPILRALKPQHVLLHPHHIDTLRVLLPDDDATLSLATANKVKRLFKKPKKNAAFDEREAINDDRTIFAMQMLKSELPKIVVCGVASINRAVVNESESDSEQYSLLVEGYGLLDVMGAPGVLGAETTTNHVAEIESVLGIEAARSTIANEISYIMAAYGIGIDKRHLLLLSDVMTFKGVVLGITRFGVSKMRESVLMLASFERTTDHLFEAASHGRRDAIVGVSECIIMGIPIPIGCGGFKLVHDDTINLQNFDSTHATDSQRQLTTTGKKQPKGRATARKRKLILNSTASTNGH